MKTSYYACKLIDKSKHFTVRTSLGAPRGLRCDAAMPSLMPTRDMLGLSEEEYRPRYIALLESRKAQIQGELNELQTQAGDKEIVILCFEGLKQPGQFCHRRIFADWWAKQTGEAVDEA